MEIRFTRDRVLEGHLSRFVSERLKFYEFATKGAWLKQ